MNTYNTSVTQDWTSNSKDKDEQICVSVPVNSESKGLISVTTYSVHWSPSAKLGESSRKISPHPTSCLEENPVIPLIFYLWLKRRGSEDLIPASQQNWHWPLNLRMLELQGSGCNSFQGGLWILALLPTWGTWLFLTVHPRACSLFYLHLAFLDPADLFADNICIAYYNKSEQWPAQSFTKFYQLPVVDASLQKGLKANALSSDVQPPLALSSPGTGGPKTCRPHAHNSVPT